MQVIRVVLILVWGTLIAVGENINSPHLTYDTPGDVFRAGQWEASAGGAVLFSPFAATESRPTHDYALAVIDMGYMCSGVKEWGPFRGNAEVVCEAFGGPVFIGKGNYVAGMTLWLRYNFVQEGWKVVPYCQIGAGAGATDIDKRIVGQTFQFNLDAAIGFRYFLSHDLSVNAEYRYQHLSNANTGPKNVGINAQGALLGVSWFF
jgi:hypothetical protein